MLDQLERIAAGENPDAEGNDLPDGLGAGLDLRKVGMFGFSLGGYATANTLLEDERLLAGIDLDGTLQDDLAKGPLGEVARKGLDQPFLLFGSGDTQRTDPGKEHYDASWASFWAAAARLEAEPGPGRDQAESVHRLPVHLRPVVPRRSTATTRSSPR